MSTEQDKDSFSLKRNRGGEGGLDVLGSPGVQLGSPDKKRPKSSTQAPSFSPLSEYAPPPNTSSDHLIAANPFDDNYSSPSLKPPPPANPYIGHYYGPPRMALHRIPSPYGTPYHIRNQPFSQNQMGFNRTTRFNYAESPNYGQFVGGINNNSMHFEHVSQMALQNLNQSSPGFATEGNMSPSFAQQQINFTQSRTPTPKQDPSEIANKNATQKPIPNCEEKVTQDNTEEKLNGVVRYSKEMLKKLSDGVRRGNNNNNKSRRRSVSSSSEPVFPCGLCLSEVNDDQEAILCEASCQKWFHRVCTGMTETAYNLLTAESSAVWGCDACMEDKGAPLLKNREASGMPSVLGEGQS